MVSRLTPTFRAAVVMSGHASRAATAFLFLGVMFLVILSPFPGLLSVDRLSELQPVGSGCSRPRSILHNPGNPLIAAIPGRPNPRAGRLAAPGLSRLPLAFGTRPIVPAGVRWFAHVSAALVSVGRLLSCWLTRSPRIACITFLVFRAIGLVNSLVHFVSSFGCLAFYGSLA